MKYDYLEAMKEDIRNYIEEDVNIDEFEDIIQLQDELNDVLWNVDSVTGNSSGSYTYDRDVAKKYVLANIDLLKKACKEFDCKKDFADKFFEDDWEWMDVIIRCYLLGEALDKALGDDEWGYDLWQ